MIEVRAAKRCAYGGLKVSEMAVRDRGQKINLAPKLDISEWGASRGQGCKPCPADLEMVCKWGAESARHFPLIN
jgi:hypothetical protein